MVRDFCQIMADWQPNIDIYKDEPVMLGLSAASAPPSCSRWPSTVPTCYTDKKVDAINALDKAFNKEDS